MYANVLREQNERWGGAETGIFVIITFCACNKKSEKFWLFPESWSREAPLLLNTYEVVVLNTVSGQKLSYAQCICTISRIRANSPKLLKVHAAQLGVCRMTRPS